MARSRRLQAQGEVLAERIGHIVTEGFADDEAEAAVEVDGDCKRVARTRFQTESLVTALTGRVHNVREHLRTNVFAKMRIRRSH